jgi:hypothetical protein
MLVSVVDDGESVRLTMSRQERIGDVWVTTFGQSKDALSLPNDDIEQWQRDMAVWLLENL